MDFEGLVIETPAFVIQQRVNRGAKLLDDRRPGWHHEVDPDTIEAACTTHGVLGQLYDGDLTAACAALGLDSGDFGRSDFVTDEEFITASHGWAMTLVELGFFVLVNDLKEPPEVLRELAKFMGQPLPAKVPAPRDDDTIAIESATLVHCWRTEIATR